MDVLFVEEKFCKREDDAEKTQCIGLGWVTRPHLELPWRCPTAEPSAFDLLITPVASKLESWLYLELLPRDLSMP